MWLPVHLALFPQSDDKIIDKALEERMELAQQLSSMVLSLRKKVNIRVRQPLARIMIPAEDERFRATLESVRPGSRRSEREKHRVHHRYGGRTGEKGDQLQGVG